MRKILLIDFMLLCSLLAFAGMPENWKYMKNATTLNYRLDFSAFEINDVDAKDYISMTQKASYEDFKEATCHVLVKTANKNMGGHNLLLSNESTSDLLLEIKPLSADDDGEHTFLCTLYYVPGNTLIHEFKVNTNGGDGWSFQEEFLDGLKGTGAKIGKKIAKLKRMATQPE